MKTKKVNKFTPPAPKTPEYFRTHPNELRKLNIPWPKKKTK